MFSGRGKLEILRIFWFENERLFWTVAFTTGLVVACVMISDVWKKYKSNSVIITFAPFETKIEEIPFPAITICNMNKILKSKAIKIME